jgi:hypothetical protein
MSGERYNEGYEEGSARRSAIRDHHLYIRDRILAMLKQNGGTMPTDKLALALGVTRQAVAQSAKKWPRTFELEIDPDSQRTVTAVAMHRDLMRFMEVA